MITLDQIALLEQKIESAVVKIQQLQAENDALRSKCAELTNALSAKSEQLTSFETDQNQIEAGIKKALDRLNAIENAVLINNKSISTPVAKDYQAAKPTQDSVKTTIQSNEPESFNSEFVQQENAPVFSFEPETANPSTEKISFDSMNVINNQNDSIQEDESEDNNIQDDNSTESSFSNNFYPDNFTDNENDVNDMSDSSDLDTDSFASDSFEPYESKEDNQDGLGFDIF